MQIELLLEGFIEFLRISIAGVPVTVAVYLFMEMFKASGILESGTAKRTAPVVLGIFLALLGQSILIVEAEVLSYSFVLETVYQGVLGGLFSGLFYTQLVKPLRERFRENEEDSPEEVFNIEE